MKNPSCPFCIPKIEQFSFSASDHFLAIYNRAPILPGHSLIIPKKHIQSLLDLPISLTGELMVFSIQVVKLLKQVFRADGFDWTIQDGPSAGQSVAHLHLHLLPRHPGDLPHPGDWYPLLEKLKLEYIDSAQRIQLNEDELRSIASHIRQYK